MTDEADRQPMRGGETGRPAARRLEHPPGDRYAVREPGEGVPAARSGAGSAEERAGPARERAAATPSVGRGARFGAAAVLGVAVAWAIAAGLFDISWGLVVIAALGGWIIGSAVGFGTWGVAAHRPERRVRWLAAGSGVATWLVGSLGSYLVALVTLPGSTLSLGERIANAPFVDALASQISLFDVIEILLLAVVAWRSAR